MSKKRLLLLINPVAGKEKGRQKAFEMVDIFSKHGYLTTVLPTEPGDGVTEQIKDDAPGHGAVVVVGGDGTLNRAVNALIHNGYDMPIGYIPLGSTNDFGKSLDLSADITEACDRIATGTSRRIDIGRFNDRYFVYIACTGMFTEASYATPQTLKNALGHGAYVLKGVTSLSFQNSSYYSVTSSDGVKHECECIFASVSNSLRAGGLMKLPKDDVSFDDGMFELLMVPTPKNLLEGTVLVNDVLNSDLYGDNVIYLKSDRFTFEFDTPHKWSLDGENGGETEKAEIVVVNKAIELLG